jgi:urease accessory protein UreF
MRIKQTGNAMTSESLRGKQELTHLLGDVRTLMAWLGGAWIPGDHSRDLSESERVSSAVWASVTKLALMDWLKRYEHEVVVMGEWPVVIQSFGHVQAGEARELIALDKAWGRRMSDWPGSEASFRVGQRQLNRLRPMRDHRTVQRYLNAVEVGEARAWHPVVYGVFLGVYGIPLRQGLMRFAEQTLGGILDRLPETPGLTVTTQNQWMRDLQPRLAHELQSILPAFPQVVNAGPVQ